MSTGSAHERDERACLFVLTLAHRVRPIALPLTNPNYLAGRELSACSVARLAPGACLSVRGSNGIPAESGALLESHHLSLSRFRAAALRSPRAPLPCELSRPLGRAACLARLARRRGRRCLLRPVRLRDRPCLCEPRARSARFPPEPRRAHLLGRLAGAHPDGRRGCDRAKRGHRDLYGSLPILLTRALAQIRTVPRRAVERPSLSGKRRALLVPRIRGLVLSRFRGVSLRARPAALDRDASACSPSSGPRWPCSSPPG